MNKKLIIILVAAILLVGVGIYSKQTCKFKQKASCDYSENKESTTVSTKACCLDKKYSVSE